MKIKTAAFGFHATIEQYKSLEFSITLTDFLEQIENIVLINFYVSNCVLNCLQLITAEQKFVNFKYGYTVLRLDKT